MDRFIERLYEYIKNHFGERMVGYYLVEDKNGIIEGRIDNKKFKLSCYRDFIYFETCYEISTSTSITNEMKSLLFEFLGEDNIISSYSEKFWGDDSDYHHEENYSKFSISLKGYIYNLGKPKTKVKNKKTTS